MTKQEELTYLFGILSEASKWSASPDDNRDLVRMEVEERIHNLINGVVPVPDENGLIQSSIHPDNLPAESESLTGSDCQAPEAAKLNNDHLPDPEKAAKVVNEWKSKRVRCQENGHPVWRPLAECHKEKLFPNNPTAKKFRWVWDGPQDKKAQEEQMWAEHEAGNASC